MKRCPKCGEIKLFSEFYSNKARYDGCHVYCKECSRILGVEIYKNNKDRYRRYQQSEKGREVQRKSDAKRKDDPKRRDYRKRYAKLHQRKRRLKPSYRLNQAMSVGIYESLKGLKKRKAWIELVDYTLEDLKGHLEKQFQDGMTWDNYGGWHIDHIIPLSVFNFSDAQNIDFKRAWGLKNLQPLWAEDNMAKFTKLEAPFQPALDF